MLEDTIGFIGGGRITRIILAGLAKAGRLPKNIVVSDADEKVIEALQGTFSGIQGVVGDNRSPASQMVVFLALHPPIIRGCLDEIRDCLHSDAVLISLAPKITIRQLSQGLGGFQNIIRMIPNAPSIINSGYNPVAFSAAFSAEEKGYWLCLFRILGESPEVFEDSLEAYAIITAMGPTYLWFQFYELLSIAKSFGLEEAEAIRGISAMVKGAVECISTGEMSAEQVSDLIPVKPLIEAEAGIKEIYHRTLEALYQKLKA